MIYFDDQKALDFLVKHKITPNQFLFLWLRMAPDEIQGYARLLRYIKEVRGFTEWELMDLREKGWIFYDEEKAKKMVKSGEDHRFILDMHFPTKRAFKTFWLDFHIAGEELWNAYPNTLNIKGSLVPAKTCDKEELAKKYAKIIKYDKSSHQKILELLKKAKMANAISLGIEKFVDSRHWEYLASETIDYGITRDI